MGVYSTQAIDRNLYTLQANFENEAQGSLKNLKENFSRKALSFFSKSPGRSVEKKISSVLSTQRCQEDINDVSEIISRCNFITDKNREELGIIDKHLTRREKYMFDRILAEVHH